MNDGIDEGRDDNTKLSEPAGIAPAKGDMSPADDGILEWPANSGATAGAPGWLPLERVRCKRAAAGFERTCSRRTAVRKHLVRQASQFLIAGKSRRRRYAFSHRQAKGIACRKFFRSIRHGFTNHYLV